jgi:hypothetical protein
VPGHFEAVLARALAVDPRARHGDAAELWDALEAALVPVSAAPPAHMPTPLPPPPMMVPPGQAPPYVQPSSQSYLPPMHYPSELPPMHYPSEAPSPGASRTANLVALILGTALALVVLAGVVTWIVTRR